MSLADIIYRFIGESLHTEKKLLKDSPCQHVLQLTNAGNLEYTVQLEGSSTSWSVSFLENSAALNLIQALWLV